MDHTTPSVNRLALSMTIYCLTGCAIGEVWRWSAFVFGYALTLRPRSVSPA
jgi:hypothetical protein